MLKKKLNANIKPKGLNFFLYLLEERKKKTAKSAQSVIYTEFAVVSVTVFWKALCEQPSVQIGGYNEKISTFL